MFKPNQMAFTLPISKKRMTSRNLPDKIQALAESIDRLFLAHPHQAGTLHRTFSDNYADLKARSYQTASTYDLGLLALFTSPIDCPDFTAETITKLVESRPLSTSDYIVEELTKTYSAKGWSDYELVAKTRQLLESKPDNALAQIERSLVYLNNVVSRLHGHLDALQNSLILEKQQHIIQNKLYL